MKNDFEPLVGKTIVEARRMKLKDYDNESFLELKFTDGTKVLIEGGYTGGYTGNSEDEYPTHIHLSDRDESKLEPCEDEESNTIKESA